MSLNELRIYQIKKRPLTKKLCKFVDSVDAIGLPSFLADAIRPFMEGPLTVV
ncbi:MAG: hypothetical protein MJ219_01880 [Mycoplasmoidaceae bacterium]|nr:hypothetical protein [Mycoplasmoidaceae bacterium]